MEMWRVVRKPVLPEDEGREELLPVGGTREFVDRWIAAQAGEYFKPSDYEARKMEPTTLPAPADPIDSFAAGLKEHLRKESVLTGLELDFLDAEINAFVAELKAQQDKP